MTIGNPGNEADRELHGQGRFGAVGHSFQIAVNQVSNRDYQQFLQAIASKGDPHGLYDPAMADAIILEQKGGILVYRVNEANASSPVTQVSWHDAVRYCNWQHNGRPTGTSSPATTEDGAYSIDGRNVATRHNRARCFLPSEDEWYKAAYFLPDGTYRHFAPNETNRPILDKPAPDLPSPWGMTGFADKTWEWTESPVGQLHRAVRSGAWFLGNNKQSAGHFYCNPGMHYFSVGFRVARPAETLMETVKLGVTDPLAIATASPPQGLVADPQLGLIRHEALTGQVVHMAREGVCGLFETRAVRTPKGDLLLMFPEGNHYAAGEGKVNDLLAYRSHDNGENWIGPDIAFKIDYSQHGFIPLIPRGTERIYAFGTQPIPSEYSREEGKFENAPIGYRWSDDDGHTWSEATLIKPANDPGFLGMSVTHMCETGSGAWILGSHAAHWSKQPLETQQYLLRSEDKGETWTLIPDKRPNGWQAPEMKRMDEGRPNQVSYLDAAIDNGTIHLFCPHLWKRVLHLTIREDALASLPTKPELR